VTLNAAATLNAECPACTTFTVALHPAKIKQEDGRKGVNFVFVVSLRDTGSRFNDSPSQELTLAKIKQEKRRTGVFLFDLGGTQCDSDHRRYSELDHNAHLGTTVRRAAQSSSARLQCLECYGLFTVVDVTTLADAS
jgi:hypothetical protein